MVVFICDTDITYFASFHLDIKKLFSAEIFGSGLAIGIKGCFCDLFSHADIDGQEWTHFQVESILFGMDLVDCPLFGLDCEVIGYTFKYHNLVEPFFGADIFIFIVILLPPFFLTGFDELNLQGIIGHLLSCNFEINGVILFFQIGVSDHIVIGIYLIIN